jgi:hypothetical protein
VRLFGGRWKLRVDFALLKTGEVVSAFFNMGDNDKPAKIKPRHKLYRLLVLANDYRPIKTMDPASLVDPSKVYRVQVMWSESETYSVVTNVLSCHVIKQ